MHEIGRVCVQQRRSQYGLIGKIKLPPNTNALSETAIVEMAMDL